MGVIDLNIRLTTDWNSYNENLKSSDSLVFIDTDDYIKDDKPSSIDLSIGDKCFYLKDNTFYNIPDDGVNVKPFTSILVESKQKVGLPFNVFGLVTGKGNQIFQGTFISTGKINPGYNGKLKIGLYNGSENSIIIKKGEPLCTCVFFEMESSMTAPHKSYEEKDQKAKFWHSRMHSFRQWFFKNKEIITVIIGLLTIIIAVLSVILNRNTIFYNNK